MGFVACPAASSASTSWPFWRRPSSTRRRRPAGWESAWPPSIASFSPWRNRAYNVLRNESDKKINAARHSTTGCLLSTTTCNQLVRSWLGIPAPKHRPAESHMCTFTLAFRASNRRISLISLVGTGLAKSPTQHPTKETVNESANAAIRSEPRSDGVAGRLNDRERPSVELRPGKQRQRRSLRGVGQRVGRRRGGHGGANPPRGASARWRYGQRYAAAHRGAQCRDIEHPGGRYHGIDRAQQGQRPEQRDGGAGEPPQRRGESRGRGRDVEQHRQRVHGKQHGRGFDPHRSERQRKTD